MHDHQLHRAIADLFAELTMGSAGEAAWVLNPGDRGLMASLDSLTAQDASARPGGRSSIASHVDHLRYGLELMNRWAAGEQNPFANADYAASWRRQIVAERDWRELREALAREVGEWHRTVQQPRELDQVALTGMVASVVHLAYHLGAIRQLNAGTAGPSAKD